MTVKVIKTTDGKHEGEVYTVPLINREVMLDFGIYADTIEWFGSVCLVQNSNYSLKLKKIKE